MLRISISILIVLTAVVGVVAQDVIASRHQSGEVSCDDFATQAEAQAFFDDFSSVEDDFHGLDPDDDGIACESGLDNFSEHSSESEALYFRCEANYGMVGSMAEQLGLGTAFSSLPPEEVGALAPDERAFYEAFIEYRKSIYDSCFGYKPPFSIPLRSCVDDFASLQRLADVLGLPLTQDEYDALDVDGVSIVASFRILMFSVQSTCFDFEPIIQNKNE